MEQQGSVVRLVLATVKGRLFFWTLDTSRVHETLHVTCRPLVPPPVISSAFVQGAAEDAGFPVPSVAGPRGAGGVQCERVRRFPNAVQLVHLSGPMNTGSHSWPRSSSNQSEPLEASDRQGSTTTTVVVKTRLDTNYVEMDTRRNRLLISDYSRGRFVSLPYFSPVASLPLTLV